MLVKTSITKAALLTVLTALTAAGANAQWLTHTGGGFTTTGVFSNYGGAYGGTVTTTMTIINDGGNDGVPGLAPNSSTALTNAFLANYPTNAPGGTFESLGITYNHTRDTYKVTMDFGGLNAKFLPQNSLLVVTDLDIWEDFRDMRAFDSSGNALSPTWLDPLSGQAGFLDWNNSDGYQPNLTPIGWTADMLNMKYDFIGIDGNETSSLMGFSTNVDIASIEFVLAKHTGLDQTHVGGAGIGIAAVPEPCSLTVLGIASVAAFLRRRRGR